MYNDFSILDLSFRNYSRQLIGERNVIAQEQDSQAVICIAERLFERLTRSFLLSRIEPPEL